MRFGLPGSRNCLKKSVHLSGKGYKKVYLLGGQFPMAEITGVDPFGVAIRRCVQSYPIRKVLEIGAFDGDGSTQVLARALAGKSDKDQQPTLVSLEEKPDRFQNLVTNTAQYSFVRPVQASSLGWESFTARDFEKDVWTSPFNGLRYPKTQVASWHAEDTAKIQKIAKGFLEKSTEAWDAVLIDGGEFFGWDEFRLLRHKARCFFLDDAFHAFKTFRVRVELSQDPDWRLVWADSHLRNGAAIYVHRTLPKEGRFFSGRGFLHRMFGQST